MAGLSETFPTLDCSQCILTPRMVEVGQHPNIKLHTYSRSRSRSRATSATSRSRSARRPATSTSTSAPAAAQCWNACPSKKNPSEFDYGMGNAHGDLHAVPAGRARPAGDRRARPASSSRKGKCGAVREEVPGRRDQLRRRGPSWSTKRSARSSWPPATSSTTSARSRPTPKLAGYGEYGYGQYKDVIDSLQFERLVSASGPTGGEIRRPSDGADAQDGRVHQLRRLARQRQGHLLLLEDLLHVHRQAHDALQAQGARRPGPRLLHGHPRGRQELRRVRPPGDRAGRRPVPSRPRLARSPRKTAS